MKKEKISKPLIKSERYFFEILVFRCDINKWSEEQKNKVNKLAQSIAGVGKKAGPSEYDFARKWLHPEWSAYYYSEVVGVVRLFAINQQIRGELWFVKERISKTLKNKKWEFVGKVFEHWINKESTNKDIFSWIIARLKEENKTSLLRGRYIDLEPFMHTGVYINYLALAKF